MLRRNKYRYVMAESSIPIDTANPSPSNELLNEISKAIGDISYLEAKPRIAYSAGSNRFILKVRRGHEARIVLALALIRSINGRRCAIYTTGVSGTIKKLKAAIPAQTGSHDGPKTAPFVDKA
ncbi:MAG: Rpp14/Pop5 family protein [Candidatus Micrarchaeota archaeon]|nr:Rpp14/Pop5 family protein [Candidatus Micrarchaeota archaeon]MDE1824271.1 Rpp14/Pop5 family protein [Candidatus Micrarchaeota archaeon]MDE1849223.1 Rpp14/Pop5 family protein [Candidatus Micrarchaeota archaeon]